MASATEILTKARDLSGRVEQLKAERDRATAKYEMCMDELAKKFHVSSIEEGEALLADMNAHLESMCAELEKALQDIEDCLNAHGA